MAGYSSASLAIGVLFSDCITKDTPPPFTSPNTTFGYTPAYTEQEQANARLIESAPDMLAALLLAQRALNTAPRFRVGDTDSYRIAAIVDTAIAKSKAA